MHYRFTPDVERLVSEQMRQGAYKSEDDLLRDALRALAERNDTFAAIRAGIEDMEAGRVMPLSEADAAMRAKLGFAAPE